jgi:hypothetical protein
MMVVHIAPTYMSMVHNIGCRSGVGYGVSLAYRKPYFKVFISQKECVPHHTFGRFKCMMVVHIVPT